MSNKPLGNLAQVLPTSPDEQWVFAASGFEHLVEPIPQHLLAFRCARGEAQCEPRHAVAHGDLPIDAGGAVHERGLIIADLWDDDPMRPCPEIFPLPIAGTAPRILLPRMCAAGIRLHLTTRSGMPAYGAVIDADYEGGRTVRQFLTAHRGYAGFSPPELTVPTDGLDQITITWPSGEQSLHAASTLSTGTHRQP